jgi:hypothetical protein
MLWAFGGRDVIEAGNSRGEFWQGEIWTRLGCCLTLARIDQASANLGLWISSCPLFIRFWILLLSLLWIGLGFSIGLASIACRCRCLADGVSQQEWTDAEVLADARVLRAAMPGLTLVWTTAWTLRWLRGSMACMWMPAICRRRMRAFCLERSDGWNLGQQ